MVTAFVKKPNLKEIEDSDGQEGVEAAILNYHEALIEMPILYQKGQGPQDEVGGQWLGGELYSLEEARELALPFHQAGVDAHDEDDAFDLDHIEHLITHGLTDAHFHSSRLNRALHWLWPLIGEMPYGWWTSGAVPAGQPAYAENQRAPSREGLRKRTVFCAGVPNLLLRSVGKRIPTAGNPLFDGGTLAYGIYFRRYSIPYSLSRVEPGDLLLDHYQSSAHQGHVGVVLDGKVFLQSFDGGERMGRGFNGPGMNKRYTVAQSVTAWNPDVIVRRRDWCNYHGDEPGFGAVA